MKVDLLGAYPECRRVAAMLSEKERNAPVEAIRDFCVDHCSPLLPMVICKIAQTASCVELAGLEAMLVAVKSGQLTGFVLRRNAADAPTLVQLPSLEGQGFTPHTYNLSILADLLNAGYGRPAQSA